MNIPETSEASLALLAFARGDAADLDLARQGAAEFVAGSKRLRAILHAMSRAHLGHGALIHFNAEDGFIRNVVVCSGSVSEEKLLRHVTDVLCALFPRMERPTAAVRTGTTTEGA